MARAELLTPTGLSHEVSSRLWERHGGDVGAHGAGHGRLARRADRMSGTEPGHDALEAAQPDHRTRFARRARDQLGCATCLAAHTAAVRAAGVPEDEVVLTRHGASAAPASAAIVAFAADLPLTATATATSRMWSGSSPSTC